MKGDIEFLLSQNNYHYHHNKSQSKKHIACKYKVLLTFLECIYQAW